MFSSNQNAWFSKLQYSRNNGAMKLNVFLMTRNSHSQPSDIIFQLGSGKP